MHDIRAIRENPDAFDHDLRRRGLAPLSATLIDLDEARKASVSAAQANQERRNALAKEIGGILATAIGPVLAATLVAVTGQWWPLAAMVVGYSAITLVSALAAPEVRGRDLVRLEDAA